MTAISSRGSILVTGATGTVGSHVVSALTNADVTACAAVRDPEGSADRFHDSVEIRKFDFERPETWGAALEGVDRLFLMRPPAVTDVKATIGQFVEAAARTGVERAAVLSVLGAEKNPLLPHRRMEKLVGSTGMAYTFLRASFFMQNLNEVHGEEIRERDEIYVPAGEGETSFVDARDVAAVAALALTESGHRNRAYDLTGPEALDYHEVAVALSDELGRPISYADPSIPRFVRHARQRGFDWSYVAVMVGIYTTARLGFAGRVTDDVARVLGREPRSIREYVADYADCFRR